MSNELTSQAAVLVAAQAAVVKAEQDTQMLEVIKLLAASKTVQAERDTGADDQAQAVAVALSLAQQQPRKGASDRVWLVVLALLAGGSVLVALFLAAAVAVKAVRELRKDSK